MLFSVFFCGTYAFLSRGLAGACIARTNAEHYRLWATAHRTSIKVKDNRPEASAAKAPQMLKLDVNVNSVREPVISSMKKAWESGNTFVDLSNRPTGAKKSSWLRNEPWWMREDESRNPRLLSKYQPWWSKKFKAADPSLTFSQLKTEANFRGLSTQGTKSELLERLQVEEKIYSLSDDNFVAPTFAIESELGVGACYPEVYEKDANYDV